MTKVNLWKVFFWAASNHPDFSRCYIIFPFSMQFNSGYRSNSRYWTVEFHIRDFGVYIPWAIQAEYEYQVLGMPRPEFDDIPF